MKVARLDINEIHLRFAFPEEIHDPALLKAYGELMSPAERKRHGRFVFAKDRHRFLITRALLRTTLSGYFDLAPDRWEFFENRYGRPEIKRTEEIPCFRFNISHTPGMILCAVMMDSDIGVDVENIHRRSGGIQIARRFFSPEEVEALEKSAPEQVRERFFHFWTLKESYIKAKGMGLSLPLEQFTFRIGMEGEITVWFDPRLYDNPAQWRFWLMKPTELHRAAVSVRKIGERDYRTVVKKVVPMVSETPMNPTVVAKSEGWD